MMKPVALSHDGPVTIYMVPDIVAGHLREYCMEFWEDWLQNSPKAAKYYVEIGGTFGLCYDGDAFIDYLNADAFPDEPSYVKERLEDVWSGDPLPKEYRGIPSFNF